MKNKNIILITISTFLMISCKKDKVNFDMVSILGLQGDIKFINETIHHGVNDLQYNGKEEATYTGSYYSESKSFNKNKVMTEYSSRNESIELTTIKFIEILNDTIFYDVFIDERGNDFKEPDFKYKYFYKNDTLYNFEENLKYKTIHKKKVKINDYSNIKILKKDTIGNWIYAKLKDEKTIIKRTIEYYN